MSIKECRVKRGFSVTQVAQMLGISKQKYQWYEKFPYKMPLFLVVMFIQAVSVSIDELNFFNT